MRWHIASTSMAKNRLTTLNVDEDVEQLELSYFAPGNVKQHNYFGKTIGQFLKIKLNI